MPSSSPPGARVLTRPALAQAYYVSGQYHRALLLLRSSGVIEHSEALYLAARCYAECKEWEECLSLLGDGDDDESGIIEGTGSDKDSVLGKGTSKTKGSGKGKGNQQGMKKFKKKGTAKNKGNPRKRFKLMKYATRGKTGTYAVREHNGRQICEVNIPGASLDQNLEVATVVLAELEKGVSDQVCKDLLVMLKDAITKQIAT